MKYLIPSYRRCGNITTVGMLKNYGVNPNEIFIGTQTKEDFKSYRAKYNNINVIYNEGKTNAAGNRNGLLEVVKHGEPFIFLDDDVTSFAKVILKSDGRGVITRKISHEEFPQLIKTVKAMMKDSEVSSITHYSPKPAIYQEIKRKGRYVRNSLIEGSFMASVGGSDLWFDENVSFADDYEASLRIIASGNDTLRTNHYVVQKRRNGKDTNGGGCSPIYAKGDFYVHQQLKQNIVDRYPGMVKFLTKKKDETRLKVVYL